MPRSRFRSSALVLAAGLAASPVASAQAETFR